MSRILVKTSIQRTNSKNSDFSTSIYVCSELWSRFHQVSGQYMYCLGSPRLVQCVVHNTSGLGSQYCRTIWCQDSTCIFLRPQDYFEAFVLRSWSTFWSRPDEFWITFRKQHRVSCIKRISIHMIISLSVEIVTENKQESWTMSISVRWVTHREWIVIALDDLNLSANGASKSAIEKNVSATRELSHGSRKQISTNARLSS